MAPPDSHGVDDVFPGDGELARLTREKDWSATDLGAVATWSQSLRSTLSICLGSRFPIALYWGPALTLLYNDAWSPIPGSKHPRALGMPGHAVWPEIWDTIGPMFAGVMANGESVYFEDALLAMHRHGYTEECYFNYSFAPVRGEGGRVEGVFNAVIETTFRVVSERRTLILRELGERLSISANRTADDLCEAAAAVLGHASHDVPFCALYLDERGGEPRARLAAVAGLSRGSAATPEILDASDNGAPWPWAVVRQTGALQLVDGLEARFGFAFPGGAWPEAANAAVIAPLLETGKTVGFLVMGVNPRRAFDDTYREFVERAASMISAAVANANAYEAERRRVEALAEIDRAKTAFFSNVSHELRTPLTLMLGPQEDALRSPTGNLAGEDLRAVHRNTLRLLKLVNSLLDFSRLEAGRGQASYEPVDIAALTTDLASTFRSAVERGGVTFAVSCPTVAAPVYVDRDMWEKIVLNLLSNAFKFTLEGAIGVTLRPGDGQFTLTIEDSGVGIPAAELPRIFERFHRVEGTRARTHEGSGIGLALVHELVRLHGGTIGLTSEVGRGSTFVVTLPTGSAHLPADQVKVSPARAVGDTASTFVAEATRWLPDPDTARSTSATRSASSAARRILVADDNRDMRDYLRRLLEPAFAIDTAADGREALVAAQRQRPALIVTDVMMPDVDGFALLAAIRRDAELRDVPVVMLSARAGDEARVEGLQHGANDYLVKPFSGRELVARIETQLALADLRAKTEQDRDRLFSLLDGAPFGLMVYEGRAHDIVFQNHVSRQLLGRSLVGLPFAKVAPLAQSAVILAELDHVYRTGEPVTSVEVPFPKMLGDGRTEERFFTYSWQALRDDGGSVWGVIGAGFDVTEPVRLRREAEEARARLSVAIDTAGLGTWRVDLETGLETRDERFNDILGLGPVPTTSPASDYLGRVHVDDRAVVRAAVERAKQGDGRYEIENRIVRPDGEVRWARDCGRVIRDATGTIRYLTGALADITERKRAALALEETSAALQAASRAKDEFLAMLGHELRNPMAPILTALQLMSLRGGSAFDKERAIIDRQVKHMVSLVDDLLEVSRITRGMVTLSRATLDLGEVLAKAVEMASPLFEQRKHILDLDVSPGLAVDGDLTRLAQVFANLLTNAAKYTPSGGTVALGARRHDAEVVVRVRDNGMGMHPEMLPRVFDLFTQERQALDRSQGGLGLGLAIVRSLVQAHDGQVSAHSDGPDRGSEFVVRLPAAEARAQPAGTDTQATTPELGVGRRILVVDDNEDAAELLAEALAQLGHVIQVAHDGPAALAKLDSFQPEIALLDIGLPVMDGYELARRIRELGPASKLHLIAVTGYGQAKDKTRALEAGFDAHLVKPVDLDALERAIERPSVGAAGADV